ncbi:hypothetical protein SAMN05421578_1066 [Paenibacillus macquariensis]|uniref:Uncharacterized protein n=2 Tax=Paenibacillus macquariensis TaxID=948756 RepID=A0ABY1JYY5_9BACL|nr:hypothetical protein SAMN05421578_1066 [Paenibacillus macquariensis]
MWDELFTMKINQGEPYHKRAKIVRNNVARATRVAALCFCEYIKIDKLCISSTKIMVIKNIVMTFEYAGYFIAKVIKLSQL